MKRMSHFEEAYAQLNRAQKQAVDAIDGPVLVIAGPGTGKTQLLTTRIANILAKTDASAASILCLTFTESAAQTMRERLINFIGSAAYDVTISTYHAFGSDLIRRFPDYFMELADTRPVDELGADSIFREVVGRLPYNNPLKLADNYLNDVRSLVSDAKRALLTPDDLRKIAKRNLAFITTATPIVQGALATLARVDKKSVPLFSQLLAALRQTFPTKSKRDKSKQAEGIQRVTRLELLFVEQLAEALALAQETGKTTPLTAWKNAWLIKDDAGRFIVGGERINRKLIAVADIYEAYLNELQKRKLFDYDDMILRAVHALEISADLRYTLQEQYLYILLDEFQDTNAAQLRLVELLTDNPVHEGRPNVLAVGDDDQAIYAFQGADYSHMLQFKELYRDVLVVPLTENYRSHADILHVARGVAEQIEARLHHHFPAIEKTLTAANKNLPARAVVERREAESDVSELSWVAAKIRALIDKGQAASDIAVLAPQHKYLEPLVAFLRQSNVPIRYEKRENVLDNPAVRQLLRMAELCTALQQHDGARASSLWAEVLSFDFWQLPTSLVWEVSWQANDTQQSWSAVLFARAELKSIALFFVQLSLLAETETIETMLDYLIGMAPLDLREPGFEPYTSPFYTFYFGGLTDTKTIAQKGFWGLLGNLIVLRARLREYRSDQEAPLKLADLITFAEAHRAAGIKMLDTSPHQDADDAVQLLTAFKAKGQEYGAVFVLAMSDEVWGSKAQGGSSHIGIPPNLQFIRYAGATNDERLRLLYVAITRAKSQLFLMNYTRDYGGKAFSRLKYLREFDEQGAVLSPLLPSGRQTVLTTGSVQEALPATELAAYWQERRTQTGAQNLRSLAAARLQRFQLGATHVGDFIDIVHCGPEGFFLKSILRFPQAPRPEAAFGNAMHETLEWIHLDHKRRGRLPDERAVLQAFGQKLAAKRLSEQQFSLLLARGEVSLRAYLKQRSHTLAGSNQSEYNFRGEGVMIGTAHLGGKIDKLIVDKAAKTITIVDYKTGRAHSRWSRGVRLHKYRQQLYFYKLLVEGSHTFAGYHVQDAYLEFVEPDEQGKIVELHLSFNNAELLRLKLLAQAVWQRILTLDLPDISNYSPDIAGIEAFEADLIQEDASG